MSKLRGPWTSAILAVVALPLLFLGGMQLAYADKIYPGVHTGPLTLGGRTAADAEAQIAAKAAELKEIRYEHAGRTISIPAAEVGLKVDAAVTAEEAMAAGRGDWVAKVIGPYQATFSSPDVRLHYELDEGALKQKLSAQTKDVAMPMKNASIVREGISFSIAKEQQGTLVDLEGNVKAARVSIERFGGLSRLYVRASKPEIFARDLTPARAAAEQIVKAPLTVAAAERPFLPDPDTKATWVEFVRRDPEDQAPQRKISLLAEVEQALKLGEGEQAIIPNRTATLAPAINEDRVGEYIRQVADVIDRPPENARLGFANGQLTIAGEPKSGTVVERQQAVKVVASAAKQVAPIANIPIVSKPANIRAETLPAMGLRTLIGSSTTIFPGSPGGRTYNIGVGARQFDGVLIKPGEEFSFNNVLGDVGPETGYVQELVILENKTEKQYGGGLCQVSTTMFRAAMDAGLPITSRTNHSYAVHYYAPIGMDATIYPPNPDMKFRNNSPGYILVQTRQVGQSVTFDFYGTADGRQSSAQVVSINATEEGGGTASFRYSVTGGPEPIDRMFFSSYKPRNQFPQTGSLN